jgi:hypothetical protein
MKKRIGHNSDQSVLALWTRLEEAKELILKANAKTFSLMMKADNLSDECSDLREDSADLGTDAINKIDEALSEVKREK